MAGLAAARALATRVDGAGETAIEVILLEAAGDVGGKIRAGEVEGIPVDEGAESMLVARPEATALTRAVGLADAIVHPATTSAGLFTRGRVRPLPPGLISGIPTDLRALSASGIMTCGGLTRLPLDHWLPRTTIDGDISVGDYVATRLGPEVVDKLVDPMLGGVYAGRAEELSLEATLPALFRLARQDRSLLAAAREARRTGAAPSGARRGPVFAGIEGGLGRLPGAVSLRLAEMGVTVETDCPVVGLRPTRRGWAVTAENPVSGAGGRRVIDADGVVLAVPADPAARLLRRVNPFAAGALGSIEYASVAIVTLVHEASRVPDGLVGSGFLVPGSEHRAVKAVTYSSRKWSWLGDRGRRSTRKGGLELFRASLGRFGDVGALDLDDRELAALAAGEVARMTALPAHPVAARVTRWMDALPQYTVGHRERVTRIRDLLCATPRIGLCGAAFDGVGVSACVGSAQLAAHQVLTEVREHRRLVVG